MTDVLLFSMSGIFNKSTKDFIEDIKINKGFNNYHKYRVDPNATVNPNDWAIVVGVEGNLTQHGRMVDLLKLIG